MFDFGKWAVPATWSNKDSFGTWGNTNINVVINKTSVTVILFNINQKKKMKWAEIQFVTVDEHSTLKVQSVWSELGWPLLLQKLM